MEKIILTEFLPEHGHKNLFDNTYGLLTEDFEVHALIPSGRRHLKGASYLKSGYYNSKCKPNFLNKINFLFYGIKIIHEVVDYAKENNINTIVCLTFNDFILGLGQFLIPSNIKLLLMHHTNIDYLDSSFLRRKIFDTYKAKYYHILQCGFMYEYLALKYDISKQKLLIWPHPLNLVNCTEEDIDCVGLSNSNDEAIIKEIIDLEDKYSQFMSNKIHIVLKSKKFEYDNGYLRVIKGYLNDRDYNDYISRARCLFLPFKVGFNIRMSGTLIDALSNRKLFMSSSVPVTVACKKKYPNIVTIYNKDTFVDDLLSYNKEKNNKEFDAFMQFHSPNSLKKILVSHLCAVVGGDNIVSNCDF